jgi:Zn-dependent metalloprotease
MSLCACRPVCARCWLATLVALGALMAAIPGAAQAADRSSAGSATARTANWTRSLDVDLSRAELGLSARAPASRLARAALRRNTRRLGLPRSGDLRLASRIRPPQSAGGRALRVLRFQQTASGLRVLWSQIDVTITDREVSSISATVVPAKGGALSRRGKISRARSLRIARRAAPNAVAVLRPLLAAYAGSPASGRSHRWRRARRVWVVEVEPPAGADEDAATGLCIVVDARTGKVVARWPGIADRPDRGPEARGADARPAGLAAASAAADDPRERSGKPLAVFDATGQKAPPPLREDLYAEFRTTGSTRLGSSWPSYLEARDASAEPSSDMDALTANAANVARTICTVRGWCGRQGGFQPGSQGLLPWVVMGNTTGRSHTNASSLNVWILHDSIALGTGDPPNPNLASNDYIAHEFGHVMDWVYAGDRLSSEELSLESKSVEEALADMFAYDYDRGDATIGEETAGVNRDWEVPGRQDRDGQPYPAHMRDYDPTPPLADDNNPSEHFNSTILSHAYYLFVQQVSHPKAGRVLHNVPATLGPAPTFQQVADAFWFKAQEIYGGAAAGAAASAFGAVGLRPSIFDPCFGIPKPSPKCPG